MKVFFKTSLKWTDRGERAFMTMSSAGLFRVSRYMESVSNVEREGLNVLKSRILEEIEIMALGF